MSAMIGFLLIKPEKAEWSKPLPQGRFRGVALHEAMGSYVAHCKSSIKPRPLYCIYFCIPMATFR